MFHEKKEKIIILYVIDFKLITYENIF
jgi:hypothetical protein